jgi:hypothetical protein
MEISSIEFRFRFLKIPITICITRLFIKRFFSKTGKVWVGLASRQTRRKCDEVDCVK